MRCVLRYATDVRRPVNAMRRIIRFALTALMNADVVRRFAVKWRRFMLLEEPMMVEDGVVKTINAEKSVLDHGISSAATCMLQMRG